MPVDIGTRLESEHTIEDCLALHATQPTARRKKNVCPGMVEWIDPTIEEHTIWKELPPTAQTLIASSQVMRVWRYG
jgi:hypothetical protein